MDTGRIEHLLELLIDKQDEILNRLDDIKSAIESNSGEVSHIGEELNWISDHSFAKQVIDSLASIERAIDAQGG